MATTTAPAPEPVTSRTRVPLPAKLRAPGWYRVPLFFMVGLGVADYWFYWAAGKATRPEEHSAHGAHSWRDYFRVNTDHKVIGIQYVVTSFFFFLVGGMLAMVMRAELAQ